MAESVRALPDRIKDMIETSEWDMRTRKGVARFMELKARSLPSIAIDGSLVYEAIIPGQEELIEEIKNRFKEKNPHVAE